MKEFSINKKFCGNRSPGCIGYVMVIRIQTSFTNALFCGAGRIEFGRLLIFTIRVSVRMMKSGNVFMNTFMINGVPFDLLITFLLRSLFL
ncbi:hypothetical protein COCNU_01G009320 [Cocos nucifera]|uniref:Uncharacterized protein n=1 Tax=Cocos nucifera TaxID=13894 RepID=A0A8K0MUW5_COCNU|nr:hypothetical protein COCNU_01G009320 [Cocos nucifera]